jgi:AcrR family transcriptional regulator
LPEQTVNDARRPEGMEIRSASPDYRRLRPGPGLSRETVRADQRSRLQRALVELVAADGYQALTVRGLAKRARISNGAFYALYRSTDDCFASTYDAVCRRSADRLIEAAGDESDPGRRLTLAIDRLLRDMVDTPQVATFALRAAPAAGPEFTNALRSSSMHVGIALEYCLPSDVGPSLTPPLLEGIVGGLARIGRMRVPTMESDQIPAVAAEAAAWTIGVAAGSRREGEFSFATSPDHGAGAPIRPRSGGEGWAGTHGDDRAMLLTAAFRIARSGYHQLSVPRVCREAGVSRRVFSRHFAGLEDCISSALESQVTRALAAWERKSPDSASWKGPIHRATELICGAIDGDIDRARLLLVETSAAGPRGVESRDHLITILARTLRATAPADQRPSDLEAEASTAAAWAILRPQVPARSTRRDPLLPSSVS